MYTEAQIIETIHRLCTVYIESNPESEQQMEDFLKWVYAQWGYKYPPQS